MPSGPQKGAISSIRKRVESQKKLSKEVKYLLRTAHQINGLYEIFNPSFQIEGERAIAK